MVNGLETCIDFPLTEDHAQADRRRLGDFPLGILGG